MLIKKNIPNMILLHVVSNLPSLILGIVILIAVLNVSGNNCNDQAQDVYQALELQLKNHEEFKDYLSSKPRITFLTKDVVDSAAKNNLLFFKDAKPGQYLLEYPEGLSAIYDQKNDKVVNVLKLEVAPADLIDKAVAHNELKNLRGTTPQIIKVTEENVKTLQSQITDVQDKNIGQYLLSYQNIIVLYDYENDKVVNTYSVTQQQTQKSLPNDFFTKLYAHKELKGFENISPIGGIIDQALLTQLSQMNADIEKVARVGDYALRYNDKLFVYNYEDDKVKGVFEFTQIPQ